MYCILFYFYQLRTSSIKKDSKSHLNCSYPEYRSNNDGYVQEISVHRETKVKVDRLECISLLSLSRTDHKGKTFTVFRCNLRYGSLSWFVDRRYREFSTLYTELKRLFPSNMKLHSLPPKNILHRLKKEFIEERRCLLLHFFQKLLAIEDTISMSLPLLKFAGILSMTRYYQQMNGKYYFFCIF